jgi:hypothetical protein
MLDVMPFQNWRLFLLVLAFSCAVPHLCVAGPIERCFGEELPVPLPNPISSVFPRPVPFPQTPTAIFQSDGFNLLRITAPPEFRADDLEITNAARRILPTHTLRPPCPRPFHASSDQKF